MVNLSTRASLGSLTVALSLVVASACGGGAGDSSPVGMTGAGASFPYAMYSKWFDEYHQLHPSIQINYQSTGSGAGIRQVTEGVIDFGATDGPMTETQLAEFRSKRNTDVLHLPTVLGAVVPVYNVPGVTAALKFTPAALAGIFLGTITRWNDPAIAGPNPDVTLPATNIIVAHRSDGSGTTYVWVDFLSKVSAEWKDRVGVNTSVAWPVGLGGAGNDGVTGIVKQTPGSIGYVELIYAVNNGLSYGSVQNAAGNFVTASLASVTEAAAGAAADMPPDYRVSITNPPGADAYPIASFTWLLVPTTFTDPDKRRVMVDFLKWMLADGQGMAEALHFAKLPPAVVAMELETIKRIQ